MTLSSERSVVLFQCDICQRVEEFGHADFMSCWEALQGQGWKARKIAGEWEHGCEQCGSGSVRLVMA